MFFFLPIGTTRPCWRVPYVTYIMMIVTIVAFGLQVHLGDSMPQGFVPAHPNPLMWIASIFMHGGLLHLFGNMLFLWLFATLTEDIFGPWLLLGFYFAGNLGATMLHALMGLLAAPASLEVPVVGASGAIAGIMGLASVCFLNTKVRVWYLIGILFFWRVGATEIAAPAFLGLWAGWEVLQGLFATAMQAQAGAAAGGIAHWAHVGGFALGLGGALALGLHRRAVRIDLVDGRMPALDQLDVYQQRGDLERMAQRAPEDADVWHALARSREQSESPAMAAKAYQKALLLFLREGRPEKAVESWTGMMEHGQQIELPDNLRFQLACALGDCGRKREAFAIFRDLALAPGLAPHTEAAAARAGEIAYSLPDLRPEAAILYQRLMRDFPYGQWRDLALDRLRELGAEEQPAPAAPDAPPAADPIYAEDPYGMGTVGAASDRGSS